MHVSFKEYQRTMQHFRNWIFFFVFAGLFFSGLAVAQQPETSGKKVESFEFEFKAITYGIPSRFNENKVPKGSLPDFLDIRPFQAVVDGEVSEALIFQSNSHPGLLKESSKSLDRTVVNFFAGMMRQFDVKIGAAEASEPRRFNGVEVTRFKFPIKLGTGHDSTAVCFAYATDKEFVCIAHIVYAGDAAKLTLDVAKSLYTTKESE